MKVFLQNSQSTSTPRIGIFDALRIVLVILVVNLHIRIIAYTKSNFLEPFAYLAVPLFLVLSFYFMSKYFLQNKIDATFLLTRIKRIFVPLLFWSAVGFLVHPELLNGKNILFQILTGEVVNVPLYYLNMLLIFTLLFWLLTYVSLRIRFSMVFLILFVAFFLQYSSINYYLFNQTPLFLKNSYGRFVELLPYAVVGFSLGSMFLKGKKHSFVLLAIILFSLIAYVGLLGFYNPLGFHYAGLPLFFETVIIFSLVIVFSQLQFPPAIQTVIKALGKYSFGVYLFHFVFLEFLVRLRPSLVHFIVQSSLTFLLIYVALCYAACLVVNKLTAGKLAFLFS